MLLIRHRVAVALTLSLVSACGFPENDVGPDLAIVPGRPDGWFGTAGEMGGYGLTTTERHSGAKAFYVSGSTGALSAKTSPAIIAQSLRPELYRGKRVRWSAWVKPMGVTDATFAGLWMRVDGPGMTLQFDNMADRVVSGSGDWREISVVLDVPQNAVGISLGVLFLGRRIMIFDDFKFEVVNSEVPPTKSWPTPGATTTDSATMASQYVSSPSVPQNLDFEGVHFANGETVDWLNRSSQALATTDPNASLDDLEPLRQMIGNAHVVGLGEGTHGTREFIQIRHRILKYLVTKMGFTQIGIEATAPESDDVNRYVMTGQGDPAKLVAGLYFWSWKTQESVDLIRWIREWNATAPSAQRVTFRGLDIQYPGASIDSVVAFFGRHDPDFKGAVVAGYDCVDPYRNHGPTPGQPLGGYALRGIQFTSACSANLQEVYDLIVSRRAAFERASSPEAYQTLLHSARLVQQFEKMMARSGSVVASNAARDSAMAENVAWMREQGGGASSRVVVWAHNDHINVTTGAMGSLLRSGGGADYVAVGTSFGRGSFLAVQQTGNVLGLVGTWTASTLPTSSIESVFDATGRPRALFDTRLIPSGGAATSSLTGTVTMRSIGSTFDESNETAYFRVRRFPNDFDVLIYIGTASASTRL